MTLSLVPNIYSFLSELDPFDKLSNSLINEISRYVLITYLAKGECIDPEQLREGYLYIIRTGAIEQSEVDGELRARLDQGDVFGFALVADSSAQMFQAKAIENTILYLLPASRFNDLNADPAFSAYFATQFRARLQSALQCSQGSDIPLLQQSVLNCCPNEILSVGISESIKEVAMQMAAQRSTSAVVVENDRLVGFVSDRNLTKRVIATGTDTDRPITDVMTQQPKTVNVNESVLHAISIMMEAGVRHLPVMSGRRVVGVINACDLVQKHSARAVFLIDAIQRQDSVSKLVDLMPQRQAVFQALVESEIRPHLVAQVITMIADAVTKRLIYLAEKEMVARGRGKPPCVYAWMVAGSQARYEMQMISDQDNAIVLSDDATDDDRAYFQEFADYICQGLAKCGYELCSGEIMATTDKWCQPLSVWKEYYREWITTPELEALLNISVFLDIRCVQGESELITSLQRHMSGLVKGNRRFINVLTTNTIRVSPPIGFFRSFVLIKDGENKDTFNIKKRAVNLIVDLARIHGLVAGCREASTYDRLQSALEKGVVNQTSFDDLTGVYSYVCSVRLRHQLKGLRTGNKINNHLPPDSLSQFERNHLKDAFRIITSAQQVARLLG